MRHRGVRNFYFELPPFEKKWAKIIAQLTLDRVAEDANREREQERVLTPSGEKRKGEA